MLSMCKMLCQLSIFVSLLYILSYIVLRLFWMPEFILNSTVPKVPNSNFDGGVGYGYGELHSQEIVVSTGTCFFELKYPEEVPSRKRWNVLFFPLRYIERGISGASVDFVGINNNL